MAFNRIVVLVDMDCFYVQVEQRRDPERKGKPCAVVQYKKYRGGGIIAVGYEARACGVTRGMMGDDAKKVCPDIHLFRVPESNGKANLDRYRQAGAEVINVLSQFGGRVERASIDEAYIDLTDVVDKVISEKTERQYLCSEKLQGTYIIGYPNQNSGIEDKDMLRQKGLGEWLKDIEADTNGVESVRLCIAATIVEEIRAAVFHQTGFRCSAGISHNKMLSKLACGINKPNKQTVLPKVAIGDLFKTIKIGKVRNLGGKMGKSLMCDYDIEFMGQITAIDTHKLTAQYGQKMALWLKEVCQGIDHEPVKERHVAQSIGCGKNFLGPDALNRKSKVKKWLDSLMIELSERLNKDKEANSRVAKTLTIHVRLETGKSFSRSAPLSKYDRSSLLEQSLHLIREFDSRPAQDEYWYPAITQLSVNAKKFDTFNGSILLHTSNVSPYFKAPQGRILKPKCFQTDQQKTKPVKQLDKGSVSELNSDCSDVHYKRLNTNCTPTLSSSIVMQEKKPISDVKKNGFFSARACTESNNNKPDAATQKPVASRWNKEKTLFEDQKFQSNVLGPKCSYASATKDSGTCDAISSQYQDLNKDVIFVSETRLKSPQKARKMCKIDQMFTRDKENSLKSNIKKSHLPALFHPDMGEIDKDVFDNLPEEIQQEILKSCRTTMSHRAVPSCSQSTSKPKTSNTGQRLIYNFIPQSQISGNSTPKVTPKRKSESPAAKSKTKLQKVKAQNDQPSFSSSGRNDVVPLGFFRQRSQLNNAIAKAISNDHCAAIRHFP